MGAELRLKKTYANPVMENLTNGDGTFLTCSIVADFKLPFPAYSWTRIVRRDGKTLCRILHNVSRRNFTIFFEVGKGKIPRVPLMYATWLTFRRVQWVNRIREQNSGTGKWKKSKKQFTPDQWETVLHTNTLTICYIGVCFDLRRFAADSNLVCLRWKGTTKKGLPSSSYRLVLFFSYVLTPCSLVYRMNLRDGMRTSIFS